jgi:hypothetical protein
MLCVYERPFLFNSSLCYILLECLKTKEKESIYLIRKEKAQRNNNNPKLYREARDSMRSSLQQW